MEYDVATEVFREKKKKLNSQGVYGIDLFVWLHSVLKLYTLLCQVGFFPRLFIYIKRM